MSNHDKQGDRDWLEVQLVEDTANGVIPVVIAIDPEEGIIYHVPRSSIVFVCRGTRNLAK